jgi:glutamine amidotransferase
MIAVIDYGMGNMRSLKNAFAYLGYEAVITSSIQEIRASNRIVLPGVGAFGDAMLVIRNLGLDSVLTHEVLEAKKPVLGICLGMQLLGRLSYEHGIHTGLGWISADIHRITASAPLKVPHVGWNSLHFQPNDWLFKGIDPKQASFYFTHSYQMECEVAKNIVATVDYGGPITAAIRLDNIVAVQFHPEKSQDNGLKMLENWATWNP